MVPHCKKPMKSQLFGHFFLSHVFEALRKRHLKLPRASQSFATAAKFWTSKGGWEDKFLTTCLKMPRFCCIPRFSDVTLPVLKCTIFQTAQKSLWWLRNVFNLVIYSPRSNGHKLEYSLILIPTFRYGLKSLWTRLHTTTSGFQVMSGTSTDSTIRVVSNMLMGFHPSVPVIHGFPTVNYPYHCYFTW